MNYSYLAGVLDSDGSFSITKRHIRRTSINYTAMVQLSWKYSENAEFFIKKMVSTFGGSYSKCDSTNTRKSYPGTKSYLKYSATGEAAENICRSVLPFLQLKKRQAENIILMRSKYIWNGPNRPIEISIELDKLYFINKSLNTKNGWKNAHK